MRLYRTIAGVKKYLPLYIFTIIIALTMRYISKINDSDALLWILSPTAQWVSILSGIQFEYLSHMGFVNHFYKFLIAPECSGCRFMLIVFLMLIFSFLYRIKSAKSGYIWFGVSIVFSYVYTILVNGIRIAASIYVPIVLENMGLIGGGLTQDRLHMIIGTATYFSFMCAAYPLADFACRRFLMQPEKEPIMLQSSEKESVTLQSSYFAEHSHRFLIPVFWYLLVVLIIPFARRLYRQDWEGFAQYTVLIIGVCFVIAFARYMIGLILYRKKRIFPQGNSQLNRYEKCDGNM
ncbi:MAG: exosortase K [Clostridiales bacterium]|nr:exosortase K [Clostridiales bacterium]